MEVLDLRSTRVTGAGLAQLGSLTKLKELGLGAVKIIDAGMFGGLSLPAPS